ncbi:Sulfatase N-terminal [Trinorchestia longiramus]|nr:Sulfatase N-terminal [Trinorchestia longiramus]
MIAVTLVVVTASLFWLQLKCMAVFVSVILLLFSFTSWFILSHYDLRSPAWPVVSNWMVYNFDCVVMNGTSVLHPIIQLETLNEDMVNSTVTFLQSQQQSTRPFLAVHSFGHVHTPTVSAPHNRGRSRHGRYGDNVEEMDDGVAAVLAALDALSFTNSTIVYFVSDHGAILEALHSDGQRLGGHNGLFKGGKTQGGMEGGIRVPGIIRYPGVVTPGTELSVPTSLLDVLPTLLDLVGLPPVSQLLPHASQPLDGVSFSSLLTGAASPGSQEDPMKGRVLLHHSGRYVSAVRYNTGNHVYKMHVLRPKFKEGSYQCGWGLASMCKPWLGPDHNNNITDNPLLFDLSKDPYEDSPIANTTHEYVDVVRFMKNYVKEWHNRVPYPPSLLSVTEDVYLLPWLQPFM